MLTAIGFPPARYKTTPAPGQRRAIGLNIVVFFFFALTALVFLTRAAVAANAINRDVANAVEPVTISIDQRTSKIPILDKTVTLTGDMAEATKPLAGHLDGVVTSTSQIDDNLGSTQNNVLDIGSSVDGIKTTTGNIKPAITILGGNVGSIHSHADGVAARYHTVAAQSSSMVRNLTGTNASLAYVLAGTRPLKNDVDAIRITIGQISGYTRSIEASPVLLSNGLNLTGLLQSLELGDILGGK